MVAHLHLSLPFSTFRIKFTFGVSTFSTVSAIQVSPPFPKTFSRIFQECSHRRALEPGKQAHARMLVTGFKPTIFVSNCLIQLYVKCSDIMYATKVFDKMSQHDTVSWNCMIYAYSNSGDTEKAYSFFKKVPEKDVISWNTLISGYLQNGDYLKSINVFHDMRKEEVAYDNTTLAVILKACSVLENYDLGIQIHGSVVKAGFDFHVMTGSALVDMYAKCKKLNLCLQLFTNLPEKNWVSWSAVIAGCIQNGELVTGLELFKKMQNEKVKVNQSTYASVFRSCAGLRESRLGSQVHAHALKNNFGYDIIVGTACMDMYGKCGILSDARKLFDLLPLRSLQSHNAIIVDYARAERGFEALGVFMLLLKSGLGFNEISLSGAFSACAAIKGFIEGSQIHGLAAKSVFISDVCVANAILDMYGKCGSLGDAFCVFDEMSIRDAVSWSAIIAACEQNNSQEETISLFISMLRSGMEPDEFTYGSVLKACASQQALNRGMEIHGLIVKSNLGLNSFIGSAIVDMYCKCEKVEEAKKLHDRMEEQTIVSWNAIIYGFSLLKQSEKAQEFFSKMLATGVFPDNFTYATVLDTCANLATISLGKQIHVQMIKQELTRDAFITSTLVDMYSKCGNLKDGITVFEKSLNRDFVTWNAMLCGYSQHGLWTDALKVFEEMQAKNVNPTHATFVAVLRACAHIGLTEKALHYFNSMQVNYGLNPEKEHYSCMVDILGRSGQVIEAFNLIKEMPFEADDVIWRTLLSICKTHGNIEMAEKAVESLMKIDPHDSSSCVLLANIYADSGMWDEVSKLRKTMKKNKLKKEPGCSWIEIKSEIHMFLVSDKAHPRCVYIYEILHILLEEMKMDDDEYEYSCVFRT